MPQARLHLGQARWSQLSCLLCHSLRQRRNSGHHSTSLLLTDVIMSQSISCRDTIGCAENLIGKITCLPSVGQGRSFPTSESLSWNQTADLFLGRILGRGLLSTESTSAVLSSSRPQRQRLLWSLVFPISPFTGFSLQTPGTVWLNETQNIREFLSGDISLGHSIPHLVFSTSTSLP